MPIRRFQDVRPRGQLSASELNRLQRTVEGSSRFIGAGVDSIVGSAGPAFAVKDQRRQFGVIVTGANPYKWLPIQFDEDGEITIDTEATAGGTVTSSINNSDDCTTAVERPLWERNGCKTVPPGTVVEIETGFARDDGIGQEYTFSYTECPIAIRVTHSTAPTTTLSGNITATATSLAVALAALFPVRANFVVLIDQELIKVGTGSSATASWSNLTRGFGGTVATSHLDGTTVTLVNQYSFTEVLPNILGSVGWDDRSCARTGDYKAEPAVERHGNCQVPDDTIVLARKRTRNGTGAATLGAAMTAEVDHITLSGAAGFPTVYPHYLRVGSEIMKRTGSHVDRAQFGTFAVEHAVGEVVDEAICEWVFDYDARPEQGVCAKLLTGPPSADIACPADVTLDLGIAANVEFDWYGYLVPAIRAYRVPVGRAGYYAVQAAVVGAASCDVVGTLTYGLVGGPVVYPVTGHTCGSVTIGTITYNVTGCSGGSVTVDPADLGVIELPYVTASGSVVTLHQGVAKLGISYPLELDQAVFPPQLLDPTRGANSASYILNHYVMNIATIVWLDEGDTLSLRFNSSDGYQSGDSGVAVVSFCLSFLGSGGPPTYELPITNP